MQNNLNLSFRHSGYHGTFSDYSDHMYIAYCQHELPYSIYFKKERILEKLAKCLSLTEAC